MMTNTQVVTQLWNWHSLAWWIALIAVVVYTAIARRRRISVRQLACFAIAVFAFLLAIVSPLAALASRYMFSAHMAQHLLLLLIVPLCAMLAWPTSKAPKRPVSRNLIAVGWILGVGAMWFWHVPALCSAAMRNPLVFQVQAASLLAAGTAFWWPVFAPNLRHRMEPQLAAVYLFSGCVGCSLLGIYVTFSPISVCPLYAAATGSPELLHLIRNGWGFTHRVDQQIGGLLMWVPACAVYLGAILSRISSWYCVPRPIAVEAQP
jgi:cytochrome c oxidase assembly factor CtaG